MAKLYSDEDFSFPVVEELRTLGHDVLTAQEAGHSNQGVTDSRVLAFAISNDRAVLTFNRRHFINLHRRMPNHSGIIVCRRDNDVVNLAARIHQAILSCSDLEMQLLRINRPPVP
jgi:predicted nuclease of predicted toxin-antitoxin system